MNTKNQFYGIDIMKFICALLVITIHTAPFVEIAPTFHFYLVQVVARIAVPFFFVSSGFLLFMKLNDKEKWNSETNLKVLKHYLKRIAILYLCWSAIYFVYTLITWVKSGFTMVMLLRYVRDFFFTGSCYHLWFLPSLMVGVVITYGLFFKTSRKWMIITSIILYLLGMLVNVYGDILASLPFISTIYRSYVSVFVTTRNGLFFAPIFIFMGAFFALSKSAIQTKDAGIGLLISFVLLCLEATMIKNYHYMHDVTSMYFFLIPVEFFLFSWVSQWTLKPKPIYRFFRVSSLLIYVSHILFVYLLTPLYQVLMKVTIPNIWLFVGTTIGSLLFAVVCIYASKTKLKWLRVLY